MSAEDGAKAGCSGCASRDSVALNECGDGCLVAPEVIPLPPIKYFSEIKPQTWQQLGIQITAGEPSELVDRVGHTLVSVPGREQAFMMGGGNHFGDLKEVWCLEYDPSSEGGEEGDQWGRLNCKLEEGLSADFQGRYEFFCGTNAEGSQIWMFGGADLKSTRNDVCFLDLETGAFGSHYAGTEEGTHEDPNVPVPRTQGTNSCVLRIKGEEYLAVFGGGMQCEKAVPDGNIYTYRLSDSTWTRVPVTGSTPNPVQGHGMVAIGSQVYLLGGMNELILSSDFFMIDLAADEPAWVKLEPTGKKPCARAAYGICTIGKDIIVCGGLGDDGAMSDLWKFNIESKEWTEIDSGTGNGGEKAGFSPRLDFAMTPLTISPGKGEAGDEGDKRKTYVLLHGGMNTYGNIFNDFWIYSLSD